MDVVSVHLISSIGCCLNAFQSFYAHAKLGIPDPGMHFVADAAMLNLTWIIRANKRILVVVGCLPVKKVPTLPTVPKCSRPRVCALEHAVQGMPSSCAMYECTVLSRIVQYSTEYSRRIPLIAITHRRRLRRISKSTVLRHGGNFNTSGKAAAWIDPLSHRTAEPCVSELPSR